MTDDHGNVKVSLPYEYGWTYEVFSSCWQEYPEDLFISAVNENGETFFFKVVGEDGRLMVSFPEGVYTVTAKLYGFAPATTTVTVTSDGTFEIELELYRYGDSNGDGKVNMRDYALLQRYMIGKSTDILLPPCDLTGDGKVNMRDYALMQRLLMGKQIEYPA